MCEDLDKIRALTKTLSRVEENLKKEYQLLEFVLEDSTDGYWDWNLTTDYEYLSPKFKAQLGYEPDEMKNSPESWKELMFPEDLPGVYEMFEKHVATKGEYPFEGVVRYKHKKGHTIEILCKGNVLDWDDKGNPLRMVGTHKIVKSYE